MSKLSEYNDWIARYEASGREVATYTCPRCGEEIKTPQPEHGDTYDSITICPHCEGMHFKVVHDDGSVEVHIP